MGYKAILSLLFIIVVILLLILYWFIPIDSTEFTLDNPSGSLELNLNPQELQFYDNMRFSNSKISYKIDGCPLQKQNDMERGFDLVEDKTNLNFYSVSQNEEITVTCDDKNKIEEGLFIAGEGGPTNITKAGNFNVITKGKILLIRESSCSKPNVAIHELLHVLGFDHVQNSNDIMYSVSKCGQEINPQTIDLINTLYSVPQYPDLVFENVSAVMHGKYLNVNLSVRNTGLKDSILSRIKIYADDQLVKELDLEPLDVGHGRIITLTNLWVSKITVNKLRFVIHGNFEELKKENNEVALEIKK